MRERTKKVFPLVFIFHRGAGSLSDAPVMTRINVFILE